MLRGLALLAVVCSLPLAAADKISSSEAPRPNFSGVWVMNVGQSQFDKAKPVRSMRLQIEHNQNDVLKVDMLIQTKDEDDRSLTTYVIGREDNRNRLSRAELTTNAFWERATLHLQSTGKLTGVLGFFIRSQVTLKDQWSLSPDGRILTILRDQKGGPVGDLKQKYVFERAETKISAPQR